MANDFAAMGSALHARLGTLVYTYNTGGTAITSGTLAVWDTLAPQSPPVNPPYVIFQQQASRDEYAFGNKDGEESDYLIKVVSDRQYASMQAYAIYATAHAAIQDAPLAVSGRKLLRCRRESRFQYQDRGGYWHVGGMYGISVVDT